MKIIDKLPDGSYYSRFQKDCPLDKNGRADKNGSWKTAIGIVVIKAQHGDGGKV